MARGFRSLSEERMREIASMGGHASQNSGHAHRWTAEEAAAAGRKGGAAVATDREHMARIGRIGGRRRVEQLRAAQADEAAVPAARRPKGDA